MDEYDYEILSNCQPGRTVFFASSGYYLKDIYKNIDVIEYAPIVKTFYPDVYLIDNREDIADVYPYKANNFAVVNNRADLMVSVDQISSYIKSYTTAMAPGCRFFYSFRDTQIFKGINRLTMDMERYFLDWAKSLEDILDLRLVWHDINFRKKEPDGNGEYDVFENPDTTNGNLKFWFEYQGNSWEKK